MQGKANERWLELCEQAAVEQDPKKLMKLIQEIDKLLREKRERLDQPGQTRVKPKTDGETGRTDSREGQRGRERMMAPHQI